MKFNIVDGYDNTPYTEIIKDYQNPELTVKQIREKHNITVGQWQRILQKIKEKNIPIRGYNTPKPKTNPKHYYYNKHNRTFYVYKYINGSNQILAGFKSEAYAQKCVRLFKEYGWNEKDKVLEEMGV